MASVIVVQIQNEAFQVPVPLTGSLLHPASVSATFNRPLNSAAVMNYNQRSSCRAENDSERHIYTSTNTVSFLCKTEITEIEPLSRQHFLFCAGNLLKGGRGRLYWNSITSFIDFYSYITLSSSGTFNCQSSPVCITCTLLPLYLLFGCNQICLKGNVLPLLFFFFLCFVFLRKQSKVSKQLLLIWGDNTNRVLTPFLLFVQEYFPHHSTFTSMIPFNFTLLI